MGRKNPMVSMITNKRAESDDDESDADEDENISINEIKTMIDKDN